MTQAESSINLPSSWHTKRLAGALGAEISGLALMEISDNELETLKALLCEHQVLFFPDQHPKVDDHVRFGQRFGPLESHPNLKNPFTQNDLLFELAATHGGVADEWHTDLTFRPDPAVMSILHMKRCPTFGGDTLWTNLYQAYEELSPPMQELVSGLTALHDATPHGHPEEMAIHPVVRIHPVTKRRVLYVNEHFTRRIVEMSANESEALLGYLVNWVKQPRFTLRYQWTKGVVCIWDNRCTQHYVLNDFKGERVIQRVTVMGDKPQAAAPARWKPWVRQGRLSATSRHDRQLYDYLTAQGDAAALEAAVGRRAEKAASKAKADSKAKTTSKAT